jgi:UDP-2,3-diacylglucosamine hydrolase
VTALSAGGPFLVVSDLHLGAVPASTERLFRDFLDYAAAEAAGLLINGDLFEFGVAYRSVIPTKHVRVLAKLADVADAGVPVHFIAGNHDYLEWGGHALEDAGVQLLSDCVVVEIAGRRALIAHGDVVGEDATRSRLERRLARSRPVVALLHWVHPDWIQRLQPYTTSTRRQLQRHAAGQGGGPKHRAGAIEAWARAALRDDPSLDFVIAAHAHLPACVEVEPGRYYLNSGDWLTHFTYLVLREGSAPELRRWPGREDLSLSPA